MWRSTATSTAKQQSTPDVDCGAAVDMAVDRHIDCCTAVDVSVDCHVDC
jgi:hypothetical protein